jgi:uncharacterized protein (TIGR02118 family)
MSIEACQAHWRSVHRAIGRSLPGLRRYVQNQGIVRDGRYVLPYPGFDICSELTWDDRAAMDAALAAPQHLQNSLDDERNFAEPDLADVCLSERHVRIDGDGPVRLMTFMRRHPRTSQGELAEAFSGAYAKAVSATNPLRHEQFLGEGAFDAIDAIWFASVEDAVRYVGSADCAEALRELAGQVLVS